MTVRRISDPPPSGAGRVRVAVVEPVGRGGLVQYAFQLCRGLAAAGADPILITGIPYELSELDHPFHRVELFRLWDPKPEGGASGGVFVGTLRRLGRGLRWYREWLRLVRFLRRERPDVVQLSDLRFGLDLVPVMLLRRLDIPLFDICHNIDPFRGKGKSAGGFGASTLERALYRAMYRRMERIFVHFSANRMRFLERFEIAPERVIEIPLANQELSREIADFGHSAERLRSDLEIAEKQLVALLFGALSPYKGVDRLIAAMPRVLEEIPGAVLVVAGYPLAGFDVKAHWQLARRLGVESAVRIVTGYVPAPRVHAWFELAEVVVLPYREGYQSAVLHLAQTFGKPAVVSDIGALPEGVVDGVSGRVIPAGTDPGPLAEALVEILGDRERAHEMGREARRLSLERFSWDAVARRLLAEYQTAVPAARAAGR